MDAVIFVDGARSSAHWNVAGTPLLIRQLEWLVASGVGRIVVERLASDERWNEVEKALSDHAVAATVETVLSANPLGPLEVARRAGLGDEPFVSISSRVLGSLDLRSIRDFPAGTKAMLAPPARHEALIDADAYVLSDSAPEAHTAVTVDGWGVLLTSERDAHEIGVRALQGELDGILVHAAQITPGVWTARGAKIEEGAIVRAPVFVGANAIICAGAQLGPNAVIGERAVVSADAMVRDAIVREATILGEGVAIEHSVAERQHIEDWITDSVVSLDDELLLAHRDRHSSAVFSRFFAFIAAVLLVPLAALSAGARTVVRELWQVVQGTRCWLGAGRPSTESESASEALVKAANRAPLGVIAVDQLLAAQGEDRLRALAWYAHEKSVRLDASLLWRRAIGAF